MSIRRICKDKHGLYIRFNCSIYRPKDKNMEQLIQDPKIYYLKPRMTCNPQEKIIVEECLHNYFEEWDNHGPSKYDTNKYIQSERVFNQNA